MSNRYKGAVISATPPTTTGGESGTASGAWTLEQQMQLQAAGLWPAQPTGPYIEDVFSTYLWAGNDGAQTITNNINLSGKGGLVWVKNRTGVANHTLQDTVRGVDKNLYSNTTGAQTSGGQLTSFTTTGFTISGSGTEYNASGSNYASWTFREQPKFFDVVTWAGNGVSGRAIPHNLGSVPGCIFVKITDYSGIGWAVYHRSLNIADHLLLNSTDAKTSAVGPWAGTAPTSTTFTVANDGLVNSNGYNYVAYLFAHDAGGFGLTETDNVISCGSYTGNGSATGPIVTLGYEPQWVMIKNASDVSNWSMIDNMRGWNVIDGAANVALLSANLSSAEVQSQKAKPLSTGFQINDNGSAVNTNGATYIYVAIRRGPMRVPTDATKVFTPSTRAGTGAVATTSNLSFPPDMVWSKGRDNGGTNSGDFDRLRGATKQLSLNQLDSETTASTSLTGFDVMTGYAAGADATQLTINATGYNYANWQFRRAPGFFDEVCYTGAGAGTTVNHNLTVVPELIITKARSSAASQGWGAFHSFTVSGNTYNYLQSTSAGFFASYGGGGRAFASQPTSTQFITDGQNAIDSSGVTYVAYLFATCAGVSKVGSYTGTGATQTIACGFAAGARFVLIKRTDSTGDWYVWDSARGMVSGTDPSLLLNSTAAEVNANSVYAITTGFQIVSTAAGINASGGTYIFLAIA